MKKNFFNIPFFAGILLLFCLTLSGAAPRIPAEKWSISTGGANDRYFLFCANELQELLAERIGKKIPIHKNKKLPASPVILLESCDKKLGVESFRITRKGNIIKIRGGSPLGTLYGVYEFTQRYCNIWHVAPGAIYAEKNKPLSFGDINIQRSPAFPSRRILHMGRHYTLLKQNRQWKKFDDRNRATPSRGSLFYKFLDPHYQVSRILMTVHSFYKYIPVKKYGKTHPEYYSMDKKGRRVMAENAGGQLCLSNRDVEKIVYETLMKNIAADRAKYGKQAPHIYDFSQLDNAYFLCHCKPCKKIIAKYGNKDSGLLLWFVNKIARKIKKQYPHILIRTFAYVNTEEIPKGIRADDNVLIWLCDVYSTSNHTLPLTHPVNAKRRELIEAWSRIAKNITIWDYILQNGDVPIVPVDAIFEDAKFFRSQKIKDVFMESEIRNSNPSAFEYLKNFLWAQAYFDPDQDVNKLVDIFCKAYYGAGHKEIRAYLELLRKGQLEKPTRIDGGWHGRDMAHIDLPFLEKCRALVQKAMDKNKDPEVALRLLWERNVLHTCIAKKLLAHPAREQERRALLKGLLQDRLTILKARGLIPRLHREEERKLRLPLEESLLSFTDIPEELKKLPPGTIRFLGVTRQWAAGHNSNSQYAKDPDAKLSRVMVWRHKDPAKFPKRISCGIYDDVFKKSVSKVVTPPGDEKYHWYKLLRFRMGPKSYFWTLDWRIRFRFYDFFIIADGVKEEDDPNIYDLWVTIKFQGPVYKKGSTKPNGIYFERCMLVPASKSAIAARKGKK